MLWRPAACQGRDAAEQRKAVLRPNGLQRGQVLLDVILRSIPWLARRVSHESGRPKRRACASTRPQLGFIFAQLHAKLHTKLHAKRRRRTVPATRWNRLGVPPLASTVHGTRGRRDEGMRHESRAQEPRTLPLESSHTVNKLARQTD